MAALLAALVACNKEPQQVTPEDVDGKVYMQFSVNMLTTRSGTGDNGGSNATPGVEVGKNHENTITSVDVVLTNDQGAYVTATVTGNNLESATGVANTFIASFQSQALTAGAIYDVYIYANCSAPEAKDLDATSEVAIGDMTKANNFWMTNAYEANEITLPADLSAHTQPNNPCNLGTHYVERSMARFDFMPKNNNQYNILKGEEANATITLTEAALINQSKEFYLLRRVSTNGLANGAVIGGIEKADNYVVDTDAADKANGYVSALAANFDYHLSLPAGDAEKNIAAWDWKSIAAADLTVPDEWDGEKEGTNGTGNTTDPDHSLNDYYIWQYAKENTIPGVDAQQHGISTGVVFKGEITGAAVDAANGEMIYVFENVLYGNWAAVEAAAAAANAPATLVSAVNKINAIVDNPETTGVVEAPTAADYAAAGFTGYNPTTDGKYYAYYYYWNRHNDNGDNAKMGRMEFAVVRNNVYKLCVDKIAKFGHPDPTDPDNPDPDPVDPNDPDEELNYYFNVTVKVLPWVVRVNHIEF